ncbi:MAG TPA: YebC/PmpR family DNA-binding transcriptional regulator [Verrucomicrobiales bacterium]|nr:YebC/PmpR family DNA-binding transcriptional regulator [Verrucomicrobiales bacterium]
MAGHNKWSKVKHIKAAVDAKKGKVFSKIARELTIAAKNGGRDPDMNPRLRTAIGAAKAANMPGDNVDRAIKKGLGELEGSTMEEVTYEGYAPGGVAMLIECVTDNKNRSSSDVRTAFNKGGGSMGSAGAVAHMFQRKGEIKLPASAAGEDTLLEAALDAGADDVQSDEEEHTIYTAPDRLYAVAGGLKERGLNAASLKLVYVPGTVITLTDVNVARQVLRLYDHLDDLDDTQNVSANFELTDEILEQLNA